MTTGAGAPGVVPTVRLSPQTRAVVTGAAVLVLVAVALTAASVRFGDGVSRPLLALSTFALAGAAA